MSDKEVAGWRVDVDHESAFVRTFNASPLAPIDIEFETSERRGARYIDAVYPARLNSVSVRWQWDDKKQMWWGQASRSIYLVNERTGNHYMSGWRADRISTHYGFDNILTPGYITDLMEATNPRTTITVTEVPA